MQDVGQNTAAIGMPGTGTVRGRDRDRTEQAQTGTDMLQAAAPCYPHCHYVAAATMPHNLQHNRLPAVSFIVIYNYLFYCWL